MSFVTAFLCALAVQGLFEILKNVFTKKEIITDRLHDGEESENKKMYTFAGTWFGVSTFFILAPFEGGQHWVGILGFGIPLAFFLFFLLTFGLSEIKLLLGNKGTSERKSEKLESNELKELEENFDSMNGKDLFSLAYKRSIRSFDEQKEWESAEYWSENPEAYSVLYELFTMYVLKSFVIPFTDGSFQFPSDDGLQGSLSLNKKLVHKEFDFDEDQLNNLKKKLQEEIKNLDFKYAIQYSWNFSSFQQIILSKGNSAIFFEVIKNQENSFSENSFTKLHDETLKLVDENQLSSLRGQLEAHRKKIIDKAIQKIEKNKTKEKVTASTLEPYIEVAEMMINERDPIKLLQAKSFLEEAVERLGEGKKTPTIKQKLEKINNLIAFFED
tara:strand:+ start:688 stop:1845 length:1158 start_codon:yes stop_codon:yes gene_type:complete